MGLTLLLSIEAEHWNLLGHPLHAMVDGFPLSFAALALLMLLFLPKAGAVLRWVGRWTLVAALAAVITGINAAGGLGEVWEEMAEDPTLGNHAWFAFATFAAMAVTVLLGLRPKQGHDLPRGEAVMLALSFLLVAATAWLGGEHSLYEEREEAGEAREASAGPGYPEAVEARAGPAESA